MPNPISLNFKTWKILLINEEIHRLKNVIVILLSLIFLSENINAQYFGRNKIKYEDFDFQVLKTENFNLHYYPKETSIVYDAAFMLERWQMRQSKIFGEILPKNQPIILYANHADFQQTNVSRSIIPQGTGGFTEGLKNRIVLPFGVLNMDNDHVLGHELVHAYQYEYARESDGGIRGMNNLPLWFVEGMAEYLSLGRSDEQTAMWMRDALLNDDLPTLDEVASNYKYFPYRYGHAIWSYLGGTYGDEIISSLLDSTLVNGWEMGIKQILGFDLDSLSKNWRKSIRETFVPQMADKDSVSETGKAILIEEGEMNLSPSISPNGKYISFLSRRELFALDLFLAKVSTGEIIDKLVSTNTDEHFDALRFMNSSGSWSPDSKKFAFTIFENGDNGISIVNIEDLEIERKIVLENILEINHLSWSPDKTEIIFSGSDGSYSNLYIYNLEEDKLHKLTDNAYSALYPEWSPDGNKIVYITDKGSETNLDNFRYGSLNIALLDIEKGTEQLLTIKDGSKHINPQFSGDGKNLFFISSPDGFSNIYRYSFNNDKYYKLTNVATGVTGITKTSSAMSVSKKTGQIVFSVFDNTEYKLRTLKENESVGQEYEPIRDEIITSIYLPPLSKAQRGIIENYLDVYTLDWEPLSFTNTTNYDPSIELLNIAPVTIGVSVDRFGTGIGGGTSMLFGDLLGDHLIYANVQANGSFKDIGGQAIYQNLKNRYNWGAAIGHIPYLTMNVGSRIDTINYQGEQVRARELQLFYQRTFVDKINLIGEYPLSTNRRFEMSIGYSRISYDLEVDRLVTDASGLIINNERDDLDSPDGLNLFMASAAYVGDYSFFGFTSPIQGSRYRFEFEPTFGTLQFLTAVADYRNYFLATPVTFAFRLMHIGRYMGDSENNRLTPLILGYDTWIRGYNINSFSASECSNSGNFRNCTEFDRLIGSKIGIFNFEVRLPIFGNEQFGIINFPYLPIEMVTFVDAGIAWTDDEAPVFKFEDSSTERIPVISSGLAVRLNVLGYIVAQVYYVYPFQRPEKGAHFGFLVAPGW